MNFSFKRYDFLFLFLFVTACTSKNKEVLQTIDNLKPGGTLLKVEVVASGMDVPWDIHYGTDEHLWVTEQGGTVWRIDPSTGNRKQVLHIEQVWRKRTAGLLGLTLHPDFDKHPYVYLNYTLKRDSSIFSRLERYLFKNDTLIEAKTILEINGNTAHNGSRLTTSPDKKIIWATGDAYGEKNAQDDTCLNGKVLRINLDGSIPADNPNPSNYVWAKGFRNIQGITYSDQGILYTAEHGDAIEDEINLIKKSANYGWPIVEGFHDKEKELDFANATKSLEPLRAWTPVIAPSGMSYYNHSSIPEWKNTLLLGTLKTQSLRVLQLNDKGDSITKEEIFFSNRYGRIRDVCAGKDGAIYISTSNRDWNPGAGFPTQGDDRILKISPVSDSSFPILKGILAVPVLKMNGQQLYQQYCASCHKPDGKGVPGIFPSLQESVMVKDSTQKLREVIVNGRKNKNGMGMPAFDFLKEEELTALINYIRKK